MSNTLPKRITVNIEELREAMESFPEDSGLVAREVWDTMTPAQKLLSLAKMRLSQVSREVTNSEQ